MANPFSRDSPIPSFGTQKAPSPAKRTRSQVRKAGQTDPHLACAYEREAQREAESDVEHNVRIDKLHDHRLPDEVEIEAVALPQIPIVFNLLENAVLDQHFRGQEDALARGIERG